MNLLSIYKKSDEVIKLVLLSALLITGFLWQDTKNELEFANDRLEQVLELYTDELVSDVATELVEENVDNPRNTKYLQDLISN